MVSTTDIQEEVPQRRKQGKWNLPEPLHSFHTRRAKKILNPLVHMHLPCNSSLPSDLQRMMSAMVLQTFQISCKSLFWLALICRYTKKSFLGNLQFSHIDPAQNHSYADPVERGKNVDADREEKICSYVLE